MIEDFVMEFHGDYFHVKHNLKNKITPRDMNKLWERLAEADEINCCRRVLSDGGIFLNQMSISSIFESASFAAQIIPGFRIAFFDDSYVPNKCANFFKLVAINRGVSVEFFSNSNEASRWLSGNMAKHFPD